jgi:hypothetical protein
MSAAGFEPVIPEVEWMQVYTLDNMAVGIDENELMT